MTSHLLALSPENITAILGHLYDGTRYSPDHRSLARVARTCRQLWSPAVAVLWRTLPTLAPMLFTLPADLCEIPELSKPRLRYGIHPVQRPVRHDHSFVVVIDLAPKLKAHFLAISVS